MKKLFCTASSLLCLLGSGSLHAQEQNFVEPNATAVLAQELDNVVKWMGVSGDSPNASLRAFRMMREMGLIHTKKGQKPAIARMPGFALKPLEFSFPQNVIIDSKTGAMRFTKPSPQDLPAMAAIFSCAQLKSRTRRPASTGARNGGTNNDVKQAMAQIGQQQSGSLAYDQCLAAVATRIAVPDSAQTEPLRQIHEAQEKRCSDLHNYGNLSDRDYSVCQSGGMSDRNAARHIACGMGNPMAVTGVTQRDYDAQGTTEMVLNGQDSCSTFWKKPPEQALSFPSSRSHQNNHSPQSPRF